MKTIKIKMCFTGFANGPTEEEVVEMKEKEFEKIKYDKETPDFVKIEETGDVYYNSYTCYSSHIYGGTCDCIYHSFKEWDDVTMHVWFDRKDFLKLILKLKNKKILPAAESRRKS